MKIKTSYVCSQCGAVSAKWAGKCYNCGSWDTLVEQVISNTDLKQNRKPISINSNKIIKLKDILTDSTKRISTQIKELDRVIGGGIIPGALILIGGDPGIGKSTLMLQMCGNLIERQPLYITGEESLEQIKLRAERIISNADDLSIMNETSLEEIEAAIKISDYNIIVIDSIQSVYSERIDASPGSIIQMRECSSALMRVAKETKKAIFIIGHITKEGIIAGPKLLEHIVDTVLQFEGEKTYTFRIVRALKNRFGSTNEIGIFEMSSKGLIEVTNPSELFLAQRKTNESGVAIISAIEGSRPILLEVQALVTPTSYGMPQRTSNGYDLRRLQMLLAVLEKRLGIYFSRNDVFVNVAGGIYLNDPASDFGIAVAIISSLKDTALESDVAFIGEIGLTGEIRAIPNIEQRISEVEKLGLKAVFLPESNLNKVIKKYSIKFFPINKISSAIIQLF
jgi:DNA repair protein RadA/Sms